MSDTIKEQQSAATKDVAQFKTRQDRAQIKEDLDTLKKDAAHLLHHTKEAGEEHLAIAGEKAKKAVKKAKSAGKDYYGEAEDYVRDNPGQAMVMAFLGGVVLSALLRGRG